MKEINFYDKNNLDLIIALGFFDCIHLGHRQLINKLIQIAKQNNLYSSIFTFQNNIYDILNIEKKLIYDYRERQLIIKELNLDYVITCDFNKNFQNLNYMEFLHTLLKNNNIKGFIIGEDYNFGYNKQGNKDDIIKFCKEHNLICNVIPKYKIGGEKISSTLIRKLLIEGNILRANYLLDKNYFIIGHVVEGFKRGKDIGFPTANFLINPNKLFPKEGVYGTYSYVNETKYKSITNVGTRPTFEIYKPNIETHIIGFDGNIYGKDIKIEFEKRLRDIVKFENIEQLKLQLEKDKNW